MSLYKVITEKSPEGQPAKKMAYRSIASQIFSMMDRSGVSEQELASLAVRLMNYDWVLLGALAYLNPTPGLRREHSKLCDKINDLTGEAYGLIAKIDKPGFDAHVALQKLNAAHNKKIIINRGRAR